MARHFHANVEAFLHELMMSRSPGATLVDAKRALKRLEMSKVTREMQVVQGQLSQPDLNSESSLKFTTRYQELTKEMLDLKLQLNDIM